MPPESSSGPPDANASPTLDRPDFKPPMYFSIKTLTRGRAAAHRIFMHRETPIHSLFIER
jgi:hypothetical protein